MVRMRSMVLTGVVVYGVILIVLHQMFMTGQKDDQHDALVHAILRDQSRLLKSPEFFVPDARQLQDDQGDFILLKSFNLGLQINITADLTSVEAMHNFSFHPVVSEWNSMMRPVIPEGIVQKFQQHKTSLSVIQELENSPRTMTYLPFNLSLPRLLSEADVKLFMRNSENRDAVGLQDSEKLFGKINVLHNVTLLYETDCGFRTEDDAFYPEVLVYSKRDFFVDGAVIPLLVPDGHAFQHFIDGVLPKLIQVLDIALLPGVQILIFYPRDAIIFEMLEALGIYRQKLMFFPQRPLHLKTMINTCITPPLHPLLWGSARRLLKVPDQPPSPKDSLVILLTRSGNFNPGRNMLNIHDVKNMLALRYRSRLVIFKGELNLRQSRGLFSRAEIIIGVHGGAFYNLMFAPRSTHIIEFMPFDSLGYPIPGTAHQIFWMQAQLIGQPYWRLQLPPHAAGDVVVPIANLTTILDKVDLALKTKNL